MEKFCTTKGEFDDIRPYNDAEVALAMQRIASGFRSWHNTSFRNARCKK